MFFKSAVLLVALQVALCGAKFKVVREWKYVNFTWPSAELYQEALDQQTYVPENNIIAGLKYFDGFYYVTLPRMKSGVPATLTRIPSGFTTDTAPLLDPYPSWEMNNVDDCNAFQNVQNVEIDTRGRMWIIDGGRTETLSPRPVIKCKPKLVVFDAVKKQNIFTYTFSENVASFNGSFLYDLVVDDSDEGYAYITDNSGRDPGIIVFSVKDHGAWKIRHSQSMRADPKSIYFKVNGIAVSAAINVASIALGPKLRTSDDRVMVNDDREVFYAPLSSLHLYSINTSVLRNKEFAMNDGEYQGFVKDYGLKASQSVGMIMDNKGVLYFSLLGSNSIARWDSHTSFFLGQKVIARDDRYLEWPNSMCFDDSGNLTLLINRLDKFIYDHLNTSEPNFRLIASNIGGRSYLYDEDYKYEASSTPMTQTSTTTTAATTMSEKLPPLKPGLDQDPNMMPQPEREPQPSPEPEPVPTQQSTMRPQMNNNTEPFKETSESAADRAAIGLLSLLAAVFMFVV